MEQIKYPSVLPHLSHDGYHVIKEAIGSSGIKTIYNKSVAHYKFHEPKHSVHFDIGTAVHVAILEPDKFEESVLKCGKDRRTTLYKELQKSKKENQIIITDKRDEEENISKHHYEGGLAEFVRQINSNREVMHKEVIVISGERETEKGPVSIELALQWSDAFSESIQCYTNIIRNKDGGTHMTGLRGALTNQ